VAVTPTLGFDTSKIVVHHNQDPRQGSLGVNLQIQEGKDADGVTYYRVSAEVLKVNQAVRVQIDSVQLQTAGTDNNLNINDTAAVNSGAAKSASKSTAWVDMTGRFPTTFRYSTYATVSYSARWSDGTLTRGKWSSGDGDYYNYGYKYGASADIRAVDAPGSATLSHYNNPALGSIKIDAGIRLYRTGGKIAQIQPFATVTKGSKVVRVQIDTVEALGFESYPIYGVDTTGQAYPYNGTARSSGTGASTSLSTAITQVNPDRNDAVYNFKVAVYYSVRWTDGTLSTGKYLTPLSALNYSFPDGQANQTLR